MGKGVQLIEYLQKLKYVLQEVVSYWRSDKSQIPLSPEEKLPLWTAQAFDFHFSENAILGVIPF